jgi:hypothetical protein
MSDPSDFDPIWLMCVTENAKERYMFQLYPSDSLNTFIGRIQTMRPNESFVSEATRRTNNYQPTSSDQAVRASRKNEERGKFAETNGGTMVE